MEFEDIRITLRCLFCKSNLTGNEDKEYTSGDLIECKECGELNDYDSLIEVAIEVGKKKLKDMIEIDLKDRFKNILK